MVVANRNFLNIEGSGLENNELVEYAIVQYFVRFSVA